MFLRLVGVRLLGSGWFLTQFCRNSPNLGFGTVDGNLKDRLAVSALTPTM